MDPIDDFYYYDHSPVVANKTSNSNKKKLDPEKLYFCIFFLFIYFFIYFLIFNYKKIFKIFKKYLQKKNIQKKTDIQIV